MQLTSPSQPKRNSALSNAFQRSLTTSKRTILIGEIVALVVLCTLFVFRLLLGTVPTFTYGHDLFAALDAGWRVNCGQRPHLDFYSPYGAAVPLMMGLGMRLAHETAAGMGVASAMAGLIVSLLGYKVARWKMPWLGSLLFAIFLFALTSAPSAIHESVPSSGMYYNRWAYGLLTVLLIECLTSPESRFSDGVVAGITLALLFFVKVNMFLLGAALLVPSLFFAGKRERARGIAVGMLLINIPMLVYLKWNVRAVWHDYRIIIHAKSAAVPFSSIVLTAANHLAALGMCMILTIAFLLLDKRTGPFLFVMAGLAYLSDVLAMTTNAQRPGVPLCAAFVLYAAVRLVQTSSSSSSRKWLRVAQPIAISAVVLLAAAWFADSRWEDGKAFYRAYNVEDNYVAPSVPFRSASLEHYWAFGGPQADGRPVNGRFLISKVNDGMELLSNNSDVKESVAVLDFVNPLSFGLYRPPSRGGAVFLAYGIDFNDQYKPSPEEIFGNADLVMVPKVSNSVADDFAAMVRNYGPYVESHFLPVAQSLQWQLWRNENSSRRFLEKRDGKLPATGAAVKFCSLAEISNNVSKLQKESIARATRFGPVIDAPKPRTRPGL